MIKALELAQAAKLDFGSLFAYQYLVSPRSVKLPDMDRLPFAAMAVHVGRKLHRAEVLDRHGRFFGYVLGIAVDPEGLIEGSRRLEAIDLDHPHLWQHFAEYLDDVAGRYVFVCAAGQERRLYTDPVAMIGCCINAAGRMAGSSLNLVLDREVKLHPSYDHRINEAGAGKYILFHTRDAHVRRLNGSFYLDLTNFTDYRFWPRTTGFEQPREAYGAIYDEIIAKSCHTIGAITDAFPTALPLSGGRDSRLIAGLAGPHLHKVSQCFTHITNFSTRYDNAVAKLIADQQGITDHESHAWRAPSPPERSRFGYRQDLRGFQIAAGAPVRMPDELERNVHQLLAEDHVVLRGHLTDLLRAVYVFTGRRKRWKDLDWQLQRLFPVPVDQFTPEVFERFAPDFMAWRRTLPEAAMALPLDFMFIETYYNATVGFTFNGLHKQFYLSPFNSRRLIELSLAINVDYRRTMNPVDDILYKIDPELCAVPYYKEAGADLSVLQPHLDTSQISAERMAEVRTRFENGYQDVDAFVERFSSSPAQHVPRLRIAG